jgi:hypothetical protein
VRKRKGTENAIEKTSPKKEKKLRIQLKRESKIQLKRNVAL